MQRRQFGGLAMAVATALGAAWVFSARLVLADDSASADGGATVHDTGMSITASAGQAEVSTGFHVRALRTKISGVYADFGQEQPVFPVSPDGRWLNIGTTAETLSGQRYEISMPHGHRYGQVVLTGWTPQGDLILADDWYVVPGHGEVARGFWPFVYRPGHGIVKILPPLTVAAAESARGQWAMIEAEGFTSPQYTRLIVDGRRIPNLADPKAMAWSPDGQRLAVLCRARNSPAYLPLWQLWVYDRQTGRSVSYGAPQAIPFPAPRQLLAWSREGRYVSFLGYQRIVIADTETGHVSGLDTPVAQSGWNAGFAWLAGGRLFFAPQHPTHERPAGVYEMTPDGLRLVAPYSAEQGISAVQSIGDDAFVVETARHRLIACRLPSADATRLSIAPLPLAEVSVWWYSPSDDSLYVEPLAQDGQVYRVVFTRP